MRACNTEPIEIDKTLYIIRAVIPEQNILDGGTGALVRFHEGDLVSRSASVNSVHKSRKIVTTDFLAAKFNNNKKEEKRYRRAKNKATSIPRVGRLRSARILSTRRKTARGKFQKERRRRKDLCEQHVRAKNLCKIMNNGRFSFAFIILHEELTV